MSVVSRSCHRRTVAVMQPPSGTQPRALGNTPTQHSITVYRPSASSWRSSARISAAGHPSPGGSVRRAEKSRVGVRRSPPVGDHASLRNSPLAKFSLMRLHVRHRLAASDATIVEMTSLGSCP